LYATKETIMTDMPTPASFVGAMPAETGAEICATTSTTTSTARPDRPIPRWDGFTPLCQRGFLEALAETGSISKAALECNISRRAAYNLRYCRAGAAFRMGWDAAILIARMALSDELMERALGGQTDRVERDETGYNRHHHDNRLGMALLGRLDRMAGESVRRGADNGPDRGDVPPGDTEMHLARIIAQDFEAFLDLVARGGTGAEAALFAVDRDPFWTARNGAPGLCELDGDAEEDAVADDGAAMGWMLDCQPSFEPYAMKIWWDDDKECFVTNFPAPAGFDGEEQEALGIPSYARTLSPREEAVLDQEYADANDHLRRIGTAKRDARFGFAGGEVAEADEMAEDELAADEGS
jgi:hypothetical protein